MAMESIGAAVGQKMRSAIKAKLLELDCYVDDELPDYIMVMVANNRSRSQMTEDLNLFLSKKTAAFVNWLHIVLKKLREVSVTNPEVYKKVTKRKSDCFDIVIKEKKLKHTTDVKEELKHEKSLTDNLPIGVIHFTEKMSERSFFGPSSFIEESSHTKQELEEIERRTRMVKKCIGHIVEEGEQNVSNERKVTTPISRDRMVEMQEDVDIFEHSSVQDNEEAVISSGYENESNYNEYTEMVTQKLCERKIHSPIIFESDKTTKRISVQDRLGEKVDNSKNQKRIKLSEFRREEEKYLGYHQDWDIQVKSKSRQYSQKNETLQTKGNHSPSKNIINKIKSGIFKTNKFDLRKPLNRNGLTRLGVMSKIYVPHKEEENTLEDVNKCEVKSVVQVKPRLIPPDTQQPNKKLLLKAMAEAQKSIEQASKAKTARFENDLLQRKEMVTVNPVSTRKLFKIEKSKLRNIILSNLPQEVEDIYTPKGVQISCNDALNYIPSIIDEHKGENETKENEKVLGKHTVSTHNIPNKQRETKKSVKLRLQERKSPSPIIFDRLKTKRSIQVNIPEKTLTRSAFPLRIKEKCKYWPTCRQAEDCDFVHPTINCEIFPYCKYGDKCLYLHPLCKFGSSCTKRKCPFSHSAINNRIKNFCAKFNTGTAL